MEGLIKGVTFMHCAKVMQMVGPENSVAPPLLWHMPPMQECPGYSGQDTDAAFSDAILLWCVRVCDLLGNAMSFAKLLHAVAQPLLGAIGAEDFDVHGVLCPEHSHMITDCGACRGFVLEQVHPAISGTAVHKDQVVQFPPSGLRTDGATKVKVQTVPGRSSPILRNRERKPFALASKARCANRRWSRGGGESQSRVSGGKGGKGGHGRMTETEVPKSRMNGGQHSGRRSRDGRRKVDAKHLFCQRHSGKRWSMRRLKGATGRGVHNGEPQLSQPRHGQELVTKVRDIEHAS
jgi:hypothetical protein